MLAYPFARVAVAALASLVFASLAVRAQQPEGTRLADNVFAQLVAAPERPGAHALLAEHFLAVAADYDALAREHRAMAKRYRSTPTGSETKRPGAPDTAVHCERLADRAAAAATDARTLAATYGPSSKPAPQTQAPRPTAAVLPPAKSADLLDPTEFRGLVEGTPIPESHARLERHYLALAASLNGDVRDHKALAAAYRAAPSGSETKRPGAPDTAVHCDRLAERVSKLAEEARALATHHAQLRRDQ